jgi:hypothetical protein
MSDNVVPAHSYVADDQNFRDRIARETRQEGDYQQDWAPLYASGSKNSTKDPLALGRKVSALLLLTPKCSLT